MDERFSEQAGPPLGGLLLRRIDVAELPQVAPALRLEAFVLHDLGGAPDEPLPGVAVAVHRSASTVDLAAVVWAPHGGDELGRFLLEAVLDALRSSGTRRVLVHTDEHLHVRLLEAVGFESCSRRAISMGQDL